ncbi:hypothetical protein [Hymenobacter coalescens]
MPLSLRTRPLSAAVALLFSACQQNDPAPTPRYAHTYTFETLLGVTPAERVRQQQPASRLSGGAQLSAAALELTLSASQEENIRFSIAREHLAGDFVGQYALAEPQFATAGAAATYTYLFNTGASVESRVFSNQPGAAFPTSGAVTITKYDARKRLLSGSYYVSYSFVPNPRSAAFPGPADRQIRLEGQFEHMPLP